VKGEKIKNKRIKQSLEVIAILRTKLRFLGDRKSFLRRKGASLVLLKTLN
jgi:hypothetical protein